MPGSELIAADLERLLDLWIRQRPSPVTANLRRLWDGGKAREHIAGVVAVELAHWDGTVRDAPDAAVKSSGEVNYGPIRQQFGSRSSSCPSRRGFRAGVRRFPPDRIRRGQALDRSYSGRRRTSRSLPRLEAGWTRTRWSGRILTFVEPGSGQTITRRPRRVVPLRKDELLGSLVVEVERVQLADDALLLVKDDKHIWLLMSSRWLGSTDITASCYRSSADSDNRR